MTDHDTMTNVRGDAAVGATTGGILGALLSFIMSTTPQTIPVIGPTVGQGVIATVVVGLLAGVGLGALAGALFGAFTLTQPRTASRDSVDVVFAGDPGTITTAAELAEPTDIVVASEYTEPVASEQAVDTLDTTADITPAMHELEGPLQIEAEVAAAEASVAETESADQISNPIVPVHTSRTRRARRVAPKYDLPDSTSE